MESVIVEFFGELDVAQAEPIREGLEAAANAEHAIIDIEHVTYLDSTLLSALVRLCVLRREKGHRRPIKIYGASATARRLFTLTKLSSLFEIVQPDEHPPAASQRTIVRGRMLPPAPNSDDFVGIVDRVVRVNSEIASRGESDGVRRWVYLERQVQAHCVSDRELVLLKMRASEVPRRWNVEDVHHIRIEQTSAWHVAQAVAEYCLGRSA